MSLRIARVALLVVVGAAAVGCTKTLDTTNLRTKLASHLKTELGSTSIAVHCPSNVRVHAGATFTCTATDGSGLNLTLLITQENDSGNVSWKIVGGGGGSPGPTTSPAA
jgi:Domain of unknown function (DUF4333)